MTAVSEPGHAAIVVRVDAELRPLMAGFLAKRRAEVETLRGAVSAGDVAALALAGHGLKGVGGGYGLEELTRLGRNLEARARAGDVAGAAATVEVIADYLARVEVVFDDV